MKTVTGLMIHPTTGRPIRVVLLVFDERTTRRVDDALSELGPDRAGSRPTTARETRPLARRAAGSRLAKAPRGSFTPPTHTTLAAATLILPSLRLDLARVWIPLDKQDWRVETRGEGRGNARPVSLWGTRKEKLKKQASRIQLTITIVFERFPLLLLRFRS